MPNNLLPFQELLINSIWSVPVIDYKFSSIGEKHGVYAIICEENNKFYIGSTQNFAKRFSKHKISLTRKYHHNDNLQKDFDLYGIEKFKFLILCECGSQSLKSIETYYIKLYGATIDKNGYNLISEASSFKHIIDKQAVKRKRSESMKLFSISKKRNGNTTSEYLGVGRVLRKGKKANSKNIIYYAKITYNNKKYMKWFSDEIEAAKYRDFLMYYIHGDKCVLNFPGIKDSFDYEWTKTELDNIHLVRRRPYMKTIRYNCIQKLWYFAYPHGDRTFSKKFNTEEEAKIFSDKFLIYINDNKRPLFYSEKINDYKIGDNSDVLEFISSRKLNDLVVSQNNSMNPILGLN